MGLRFECKLCGYSCSDVNEENMIEDMDEHLYFEHHKEVYTQFVNEINNEGKKEGLPGLTTSALQ